MVQRRLVQGRLVQGRLVQRQRAQTDTWYKGQKVQRQMVQSDTWYNRQKVQCFVKPDKRSKGQKVQINVYFMTTLITIGGHLVNYSEIDD